jgi:hypothetical protein
MAALPAVAQASVTVTPVLSLTGQNAPESIAIDHKGDMYLSQPLAGTVLVVVEGTPRPFVSLPGTVLGVRLDEKGDLYAAVVGVGLFEVPAGSTTPKEIVKSARFWNGMAFDHRGNLYVSESGAGQIWRLAKNGAFTLWSDSLLLRGTVEPGPCGLVHPAVGAGFGAIGANGVFFNKHGDMLVSNTDLGTVVRIPVEPDGSAGEARVFAGPSCTLWGADGGAMDDHDNLYVAANSGDKIVRVDSRGRFTVFSDSRLLHFPTDIAFGTHRGDRKVAYITNLALTSNFTNGGVVKMEVGVPGRPLP